MIDGVGGVAPKAVPRRGPVGRDQGGFRVSEGAETTARSVSDIASVTMAGMLALQGDACDAVQDREARRRGQDLLGALSDLQCALLGGGGDERGLRRLAQLAQSVPRAADRGLRDVVAAIALRASVEVARRDLAARPRDPALGA